MESRELKRVIVHVLPYLFFFEKKQVWEYTGCMDSLTFLEDRIKKTGDPETVSILSVPLGLGSKNTGTTGVLPYLMKLGLRKAMEYVGFAIDVLPAVDVRHSTIPKITVETRTVVARELFKGNRIVVLGGDHSVALGSIAGAAEAFEKEGKDIGVIWIDAHSDINTHATSLTGNVHGMVSAAILGIGAPELTGLVTRKIKKENILYVGLRDIDQAEIDILRAEKLMYVTMHDIILKGFAVVTEHINRLNDRIGKNGRVWISLDIDAVDERYAPASAMTTSGGLSYREVVSILTYIGKTSPVAGMDLVEMVPKKDIEHTTGLLALELIAAAFGGKYDWYRRYMSGQ